MIDELDAMLAELGEGLKSEKEVKCPHCNQVRTVPIERKLSVCPDCYKEWRVQYTGGRLYVR